MNGHVVCNRMIYYKFHARATGLPAMDYLTRKSDPYLVMRVPIPKIDANNGMRDHSKLAKHGFNFGSTVVSTMGSSSSAVPIAAVGVVAGVAATAVAFVPVVVGILAASLFAYATKLHKPREGYSEVFVSKKVKRNLDPVWPDFTIGFDAKWLDDPHAAILVECWDYDHCKPSDYMGCVEIPLHTLLHSNGTELRFEFVNEKGKAKGEFFVSTERLSVTTVQSLQQQQQQQQQTGKINPIAASNNNNNMNSNTICNNANYNNNSNSNSNGYNNNCNYNNNNNAYNNSNTNNYDPNQYPSSAGGQSPYPHGWPLVDHHQQPQQPQQQQQQPPRFTYGNDSHCYVQNSNSNGCWDQQGTFIGNNNNNNNNGNNNYNQPQQPYCYDMYAQQNHHQQQQQQPQQQQQYYDSSHAYNNYNCASSQFFGQQQQQQQHLYFAAP